MGKKAVFYHAGCPICVEDEQQVAQAIDRSRFDVEVVHLGEQKGRVAEGRAAFGVTAIGRRSLTPSAAWAACALRLPVACPSEIGRASSP